MGVVKYRNWEELVSDLATQQPEVKLLSGPLDSISFDLQANSDWMHTGAAHPPCIHAAVSVSQSHKGQEEGAMVELGMERWKDRGGKKGDR